MSATQSGYVVMLGQQNGYNSPYWTPVAVDQAGSVNVNVLGVDDSGFPTAIPIVSSPSSPISAGTLSDYLVCANFPWNWSPDAGVWYQQETLTDALDSYAQQGFGGLFVVNRPQLFSSTSTVYDRQRSLPDDTDGNPTGNSGLAGTVSRSQAYNPATSLYDRIVTLADDANGQAAQGTGLQGVVARLQAIDTQAGTFDRLGCEGTDQDANPALNAGVLVVNTHPRLWNGADYDRVRGNEDISLQASAAQAAASTVLSGDQTNYNARGVKLLVNVTAITAGDTLTVTLRGKDVVSGVYYTILASVAIGAVGSYPLTVFPGAPVSANVSANDQLPRTWDVEYVTAGANAVTFSVGASVLL